MKVNRRLALIASAFVAAPLAAADVLHDTLFITDTGLQTNAIAANIGGYLVWGRKIDSQVSDDFAVPAGGRFIDTVTADSIGYVGTPPADGVLVEVFADLGGYPSETPTWSYLATGGDVSVEIFGFPWGGPRYRITVTLPADTFSLAEGNWFISQTPIDTTDFADGYFLFRGAITYYGSGSFVRNGGLDHAAWWFGGFPGVWPSDNWTAESGGAGESAFQVTGHASAGCKPDYNGDGFMDGIDYDLFMADFENLDPAQQMHADYNGDGFVDGIDYDLFMNDFAIGC